MSLLDEVRATATRPGSRCTVATLRATLSETDAAELDDLLADPTVRKSDIARALTNRGHRMSGTTLARHARGVCMCGVA